MLRLPLEPWVWPVCRKVPRVNPAAVPKGQLIAVPQEGRHGWMLQEFDPEGMRRKDVAVVSVAKPRFANLKRLSADTRFVQAMQMNVRPHISVDRPHPNSLILQASHRYGSNDDWFIGLTKNLFRPGEIFYVLAREAEGIKAWFPEAERPRLEPEMPKGPGPVGPLQGQQRKKD